MEKYFGQIIKQLLNLAFVAYEEFNLQNYYCLSIKTYLYFMHGAFSDYSTHGKPLKGC